MRNLARHLPLFLLSLALSVAAGEAAAGEQAQKTEAQQKSAATSQSQNEDDRYSERFAQLDHDQDGYVERAEWPLAPESFDVVDRDKDGRLSRVELLTPNVILRDRPWRFQELDVDRDGRLSRLEWQRSGQGFGALDGDRDGYVTMTELRRAQVGSDSPIALHPQDRHLLRNLDRNGDNRVGRLEWRGSRDVFNRLDRNRDGFLSPSELRR